MMDSCNRIYHGVENEEIYLWVVVVVAGTRRFARKSSPEKVNEMGNGPNGDGFVQKDIPRRRE